MLLPNLQPGMLLASLGFVRVWGHWIGFTPLLKRNAAFPPRGFVVHQFGVLIGVRFHLQRDGRCFSGSTGLPAQLRAACGASRPEMTSARKMC